MILDERRKTKEANAAGLLADPLLSRTVLPQRAKTRDERFLTVCHSERRTLPRVEESKAGFTLMELMVYMAIVGVIVLVAGEAFSNSTKFRVRTENMIRATQEAENAGMLLKTDVEQLGAKSAKETGDAASGSIYGDNFGSIHSSVYMDPSNTDETKKDSSSFLIKTENGFSNLTMRRLRYDDDGFYVATEEVNWFVEDGTLKRTCKLIDKKVGLTVDDSDPCSDVNEEVTPVTMATQVSKFTIIAAKPGAKVDSVQVFPVEGNSFRMVSRQTEEHYVRFKATNLLGEENNGGTGVIFSDFFSNYDNLNEKIRETSDQMMNQAFAVKDETVAETDWKKLCTSYGRLSLKENQEYEISFNVDYPGTNQNRSLVFVPGSDHMAVGFRSISNGKIPELNGKKLIDDFLFFPPVSATGTGARKMRFHVPHEVNNVCLAFTFALYSPLVSQGTVTIKNLKLLKVASSDYTFTDPPFDAESNKVEKKNVKALRLELQISRGAKNGGKGETGNVLLVIPIPSNGPRG